MTVGSGRLASATPEPAAGSGIVSIPAGQSRDCARRNGGNADGQRTRGGGGRFDRCAWRRPQPGGSHRAAPHHTVGGPAIAPRGAHHRADHSATDRAAGGARSRRSHLHHAVGARVAQPGDGDDHPRQAGSAPPGRALPQRQRPPRGAHAADGGGRRRAGQGAAPASGIVRAPVRWSRRDPPGRLARGACRNRGDDGPGRGRAGPSGEKGAGSG